MNKFVVSPLPFSLLGILLVSLFAIASFSLSSIEYLTADKKATELN
ncbi:hypothetical protein [Colwellia sp. TT2012]|nr:hypothetical protein [Colwellia sp. TT2012]